MTRFRAASAAFVATVALLFGSAAQAHAEPTPAEIEKQIDQQWNQLEPVIEEHNATKIKLGKQRQKAGELAKQITPLEQQVVLSRARVGFYADYMYRGGVATEINAVLRSGDATIFADRLMSLDMVAHNYNLSIADIVRAKKKLDDAKKPLDELVTQLSKLEAEQSARAKKIEDEIKKLNALRLKAYGNLSGPGELAPVPCPVAYPGGAGSIAAKFACQQIGKQYVWGSAGPNTFDCSGLMLAAWAKVGVSLPHNAKAQRSTVKSVTRAQLRPGDLVFYYSDLHHVGMYVGGDWIVHASQAGKPIQMRKMDNGSIHSYGRPG